MNVKEYLEQFKKVGIKILSTNVKDNTTVKIELSLENERAYCIEYFGMAPGNTLDAVENAI